MPINRRLPKRGFKNPFSKTYQIVNLRDLERLGDETTVNAEVLCGAGIIKSATLPVKLTLSIPGCPTRYSLASLPAVTMLITPAGSSASATASASR